jgi:hypothetical protein
MPVNANVWQTRESMANFGNVLRQLGLDIGVRREKSQFQDVMKGVDVNDPAALQRAVTAVPPSYLSAVMPMLQSAFAQRNAAAEDTDRDAVRAWSQQQDTKQFDFANKQFAASQAQVAQSNARMAQEDARTQEAYKQAQNLQSQVNNILGGKPFDPSSPDAVSRAGEVLMRDRDFGLKLFSQINEAAKNRAAGQPTAADQAKLLVENNKLDVIKNTQVLNYLKDNPQYFTDEKGNVTGNNFGAAIKNAVDQRLIDVDMGNKILADFSTAKDKMQYAKDLVEDMIYKTKTNAEGNMPNSDSDVNRAKNAIILEKALYNPIIKNYLSGNGKVENPVLTKQVVMAYVNSPDGAKVDIRSILARKSLSAEDREFGTAFGSAYNTLIRAAAGLSQTVPEMAKAAAEFAPAVGDTLEDYKLKYINLGNAVNAYISTVPLGDRLRDPSTRKMWTILNDPIMQNGATAISGQGVSSKVMKQ